MVIISTKQAKVNTIRVLKYIIATGFFHKNAKIKFQQIEITDISTDLKNHIKMEMAENLINNWPIFR